MLALLLSFFLMGHDEASARCPKLQKVRCASNSYEFMAYKERGGERCPELVCKSCPDFDSPEACPAGERVLFDRDQNDCVERAFCGIKKKLGCGGGGKHADDRVCPRGYEQRVQLGKRDCIEAICERPESSQDDEDEEK